MLFVGLLANLAAAQSPVDVAPKPPHDEPAPPNSAAAGDDLDGLSLAELMEIEVTVANRHGERLQDVPAAVYVLTGDEIRRAGHTTIQEALRMVPGFHVARWKSAGWDVTARGFTGSLSSINESFANQLLLVIDGVSVYSPAMAGIWWPLHDIPIESIERIEIIRGPAGTLWGANAMNGVVHVITKQPSDTTGWMASSTVGETEQRGALTSGGSLGDRGWYRAFVSYAKHDAMPNADGDELPEDWRIASAGMRADWDLGDRGRTRLWARVYGSEFGEEPPDTSILGLPLFDETPKNGGIFAGSWEVGEPEDMHRLQAWYWADYQKQVNLQMDVQNLDVEYSRHNVLNDTHALTWGVGYRGAMTNLKSENGYNDFDPQFRLSHAGRVFVQDELSLAAWRSRLLIGAQAEAAEVGDFTLQPNLRWIWTASEATSIWASVSRAVRTPSREELDNLGYDDPLLPPVFAGNKNFRNESVLAHELGVRTSFGDGVQLDVTGFYNEYDDLQTFELTPLVVTYGNRARATAFGAEVALDLTLSAAWRLRTAYTYFDMDFEADASSASQPTIDLKDGLIPKNHANIRSYYDLGDDWELDTGVYWTDYLPYFDSPSYFRVDARLGWRPSENVELSIGVQNAQERRHAEAGEDILNYGGEVHRNVYASLRLSF